MQDQIRTFIRAVSTGVGARAWRPWLIAGVLLVATLLSLCLALQNRTLDGAARHEQSLVIAKPGEAKTTIVSLRRPGSLATFTFQASDFATQVDGLETYSQVDSYLQRQSSLMAITNAPTTIATLKATNGTLHQVELPVRPIRLRELRESFWVSLGVGLIAFLVGGWVWCLKPNEAATQMLGVNGFGMLVAAVASSASFAQTLALPPLC